MSPSTNDNDSDEDAGRRRINSEHWTNDEEDDERNSLKSGSSSSSDLTQPPPPKRRSLSYSDHSYQSEFSVKNSVKNETIHSATSVMLPFNPSKSSLVSYGAQDDDDDDEDQFERGLISSIIADKRANAARNEFYGQFRSNSNEREVKPPPPPPGHQDCRSPDEIAVDNAIEQGLRELSQSEVHYYHSTVESQRSFDDADSPSADETEVKLPPSPEGKCSKEIEEKFKNYFARKANGFDLNLAIKRRRDFKNPSMYEKLIEKFDVDELGSNFDKTVFDPHGFTKDCFYDRIAVVQKEMMERHNAAAEKKIAPAVPTTSKSNEAKRKSRFAGNKKQ
ncbi:unnamed protein product [Dracunculus medinensis]|uniref:SAP30-binding protein n=1 Tax=Dracunculus medinensis TaxID=318479 RepID=A0A0N4UI22_DRAME|nr:unnamed protein product [Dracunculus medinensis]